MLSPASSFSRSASRSAARRLLTKISVERCSRTSFSSSGYIAGQIDLRVASWPWNGSSSRSMFSGSTIDSTGTWIFRSSGLRMPVSTTVTRRFGPTMKRPTSSSGFWVAERPTRCTSRPATSTNRSNVIARCAPRLVCATAWISSRITVSVPSKIARAWLVSIRYSDSGVVISTSGGCLTMSRRSFCGVSPVRIATFSSAPIPRSGARRFFSTS